MYIQITSKCNMQCSHCCYSCGPKGKHSSIETIKNAIEFNKSFFDGNLFIGGVEPTLHPQFWEIFGIMLDASIKNNDMSLGMVTNGTVTKTAFVLAQLNSDIFNCAISLDDLHYPRPEDEVIKAFGNNIRSTEYHRVSPVGRAKRTYFSGNDFHCVCEDIVVDEKGNLFTCGCKNFKLGNVNNVTQKMIENVEVFNGFRRKLDDFDGCLNEKAVKPRLRKSFRNFLKYGDSNGKAI